MFTIVLAVSTIKTSWKRSCECETSVTIVRMSCDNVAINKKHKVHIYIIYSIYIYIYIYIKLDNRIYSYIFIYNYIFMYSKCKFNVDLYWIIRIDLIVNMPESSNIFFSIILFCQSILPWHVKDVWEIHQVWKSWFLLSTYKHAK